MQHRTKHPTARHLGGLLLAAALLAATPSANAQDAAAGAPAGAPATAGVAVTPAAAVTPAPQPVTKKLSVAVLPLNNLADTTKRQIGTPLKSNQQFITEHSLILRAELETWFACHKNVSVMERERIDAIVRELIAEGDDFSFDKLTVTQRAKFKGISHLVDGNILSIAPPVRTVRTAYGVTTWRTDYSARFQMKLTSVATAELAYSKIYDLKWAHTVHTPPEQTGGDSYAELMRQLKGVLDGDEKLEKFLKGDAPPPPPPPPPPPAAPTVPVSISPSPERCDIFVGDILEGTSPVEINQPEGQVVQITIKKQGYEEWKAKVRISKGLKLSPELAKKEAAKKTPKEESKEAAK